MRDLLKTLCITQAQLAQMLGLSERQVRNLVRNPTKAVKVTELQIRWLRKNWKELRFHKMRRNPEENQADESLQCRACFEGIDVGRTALFFRESHFCSSLCAIEYELFCKKHPDFKVFS